MIDLVNVQKLAQEATQRQIPNDPALRDFAVKVVESIDLKILARQETALIHQVLPPIEAKTCLAFINAPVATKVMEIVKKHSEIRDAVPELENLPPCGPATTGRVLRIQLLQEGIGCCHLTGISFRRPSIR